MRERDLDKMNVLLVSNASFQYSNSIGQVMSCVMYPFVIAILKLETLVGGNCFAGARQAIEWAGTPSVVVQCPTFLH